MISDLLADSNLPPNVASILKIISTMIAPPTAFHVGQRPFVSPMSPLIEKFRDEHQEDKVKDQPDLKEDLSLPMVGVSILHMKIILILLISCAKERTFRKLIGGRVKYKKIFMPGKIK